MASSARRPRGDEVEVTFVESPSSFYVRKLHQLDVLQKIYDKIGGVLEKIRDKVGDAVRLPPLVPNPEAGIDDENLLKKLGIRRKQMVLAKCPKLPDFPFHRGTVMEGKWDSTLGVRFRIHFVDYGFQQWVGLEETAKLPAGLISIPSLSQNCSIRQCFPPLDGSGQVPSWSGAAVEHFRKLVQVEEVITMEVFDSNDDVNSVDLLIWPGHGCYPCSVRDLMVFEGWACLSDGRDFLEEKVEAVHPVLPEMEVPVESHSLVRISHVENPHEIYVQPVSLIGRKSEIFDHLHVMLDKCYSKRRKEDAIWVPHVGQFNAVRSQVDGRFYRAVVERIPAFTRLAQACLVDVGRREICVPKDMYPLGGWFEYAHPFRFTVCVALDNLLPRSSRYGWDDESITFLEDKMGKDLLMYVVKPSPKPRGDFMPPLRQTDINVGLFQLNAGQMSCLASEMVSENLARFERTEEDGIDHHHNCLTTCQHPCVDESLEDFMKELKI